MLAMARWPLRLSMRAATTGLRPPPLSQLLQHTTTSLSTRALASSTGGLDHLRTFARPSSSAAATAESLIVITDRCAQRILELNKEPTVQKLLRLSVEPGGCSGFSYNFQLEELSQVDEDEDRIFERDGARVVVDGSSLELLAGATIDFEEEMMKSVFVVADNPQSSASCGCGTSFQAKDLF